MTRVVLLGDAGLAHDGDSVLAAARQCAMEASSKAVVLLGDNVYGNGKGEPAAWLHLGPYGGLPKPMAKGGVLGVAQLERQLNAFTGLPLYVVPGNHDWYRGKSGVLDETRIVTEHGATWLPGPLCSNTISPEVIAAKVQLVGLDSMGAHAGRCHPLRGMSPSYPVSVPMDRKTAWLIVAMHHPIRTIGKHHKSGDRSAKLLQDSGYRTIVVSGHDHLLADLNSPTSDVFRQIVSGAGSVEKDENNSRVHDTQVGDHWSLDAGFVLLDQAESGIVVHLVTIPSIGPVDSYPHGSP
ncbi:MAG: metallophosphoesterase [Myxococcota bacterium]